MPPKTEGQKQMDELARREAAYAGPAVVDRGMEVGGAVMPRADKLKEAESRMTTDELKQLQRERTTKYGYPPVK